MKYKYIISGWVAMCLFNSSFAQNSIDTTIIKTFDLGEIVVTKSVKKNNSSEIYSQQIAKFQKTNISDALNLLPGVSLSKAGGRNEVMVNVRGYDLRQVPVFIDGMPVYVPYDGYIDLSRFQMGSISKITVKKGFSSMLYGANSMGGAINIVSAMPQSNFELFGNSGVMLSSQGLNGYFTSLNLGTRQQKWYAMANIGLINRDFISLSSDFKLVPNEADLKRDNSFSNDLQYQLKAGFMPKDGHEYVLSYSGVRADKGVPVYLGNNKFNKVRYWQYPEWNKDCFYFHSKTAISEKINLKTRIFYDTYFNELKNFDNNTYTTQNSKSAFTSIYDDHSFGGAVELGIGLNENHQIILAVNTKYDHHKEYNVGQQDRYFHDNTKVFALENSWKLAPRLSFVGGLGLYTRTGIRADDYRSANDSVLAFPLSNDLAFNYQGGFFFDLSETQIIHLSIARKSRFATMKDRYSYRLGLAIPNPDLNSELAINTEIGYSGSLKAFQWTIDGFYNLIDQTIQQVNNVEPGIYQFQNTGKSQFRGIEGSIGWNVSSFFMVGSNYTFIDKQNKSNPEIKFIDVPKHKASLFTRFEKAERYSVLFDAEYNSERNSTSDGLFVAPSYILFNFNAEYALLKWLTIKTSIHNIFDKMYFVSEGYPEEGRTFSLSLSYKFSK